MNDERVPSRVEASVVGKPIGWWILPAMFAGVMAGLHAVLVIVTSRNLWFKFRSPDTSPFSLTHMMLLLALNSAGVGVGVIAFRAWARHSPRRGLITTLLVIALFAVAYGVHMVFIYNYV